MLRRIQWQFSGEGSKASTRPSSCIVRAAISAKSPLFAPTSTNVIPRLQEPLHGATLAGS